MNLYCTPVTETPEKTVEVEELLVGPMVSESQFMAFDSTVQGPVAVRACRTGGPSTHSGQRGE